MDFDFTIDDEPEEKLLATPDHPSGPNLQEAMKMTPRKFAKSVLAVYHKLGGDQWLLTQAMTDPNQFFKLLQKILPNNVKLDGDDALTINLIERFGQQGVTGDSPADNDIAVADRASDIGATVH